MPIYEYKCPKCNSVIERIEKISEKIDEPLCDKCQSTMSKIISKSTFKLLGTGWYTTDYKNNSHKKSYQNKHKQ
jgi:putative FmdB family regulatory protein